MKIVKIFHQLHKQYGPQHWWPIYHKLAKNSHCKDPDVTLGDEAISRFEICIGAILTQNTAWTNVEKAIKCLLEANLMSPRAIAACPTAKLQKCVRSSGYYKQKAKKLKIFSRWLIKNYQGDLRQFFKKPLAPAREELLSLWGIGPETADSMLLYAGRKPIFVIDAYTKRLCRRHGVEFKTYNKYQQFFEKKLIPTLSLRAKRSNLATLNRRLLRRFAPRNDSYWTVGDNLTKLYNEFHALIVKWGKES